MNNQESIRCLKGIGEKTEKLFAKIGIRTLNQLIHAYPREYISYDTAVLPGQVCDGKTFSVLGKINRAPGIRASGKKTIITMELTGDNGTLSLIWFNMPFLRTTLRKGSVFVFRGKVVCQRGKMVMEHPEIFTPAAYEQIENRLQPIYALTAGLTNKTFIKTMQQALEARALEKEYLPESLRNRYQLAEINFAITQIHFPKDRESLQAARKRLIFDEFLFFILALSQLKEKTVQSRNYFPMKQVWKTEEVIENLPYQLTNAQLRVWSEIENDLKGEDLMARLVQGDVGSGKTVLAFLSMIMAAENGYQSALMVPTEVLARQHFEELNKLLEENGLTEYHPVLLTGSNTAKEKRERYRMLEQGESKMIIGTHALIQEKVKYRNLALVITDEQHRFGVRQRTALAEKGYPPNVLVMSATPIPRTLAIILYGDLDISAVDELPSKRLPIKNCVVDKSYRSKAYRFMEKQIREGRQVYIICPMVEESESLEVENVTDYTEKLRTLFPREIEIGMLHGQMKPMEKNKIMEAFAANEIQILVSTTVVEVGVNVPNATVMMVENAERFGLAQLHQLRGRVGRGEHQSYCIFMQGGQDEQISKRLEILNKSNDGFYIAGEDLKLRGPGDLLGIRQSGDLVFAIADVFRDASLLSMASEAAKKILSEDPSLIDKQHQLLKNALAIYTSYQTEDLGL